MECRMDGRNALITGSSRGLGRAMAMSFASSGANVVVCGRREDVLAETQKEVEAVADGKVIAIVSDVSSADGVNTLLDGAESALGHIDILVNNAGASKRAPFCEITDEEWAYDFELKVYGAIRTCRRLMPGMMERKWGRIINVLNVGAKAPPGGGAPTAVSRATGMAITKVLSKEGAPHNVLANALLVGRIESDQWLNRWEDTDKSMTYDEFLDDMAKDLKLPIGRLGTAEEFANLACFLCSDAGSYINGVAINVDGGTSPAV